MSDCERFYRQRDRRTSAYLADSLAPLSDPVVIRVAPQAAATRAGQLASLALTDMAARVHRHILIDGPDVALLAEAVSASGQTRFLAALQVTADRIDPCGTHTLTGSVPAGVPVVGVGDVGDGWKVGASGATGVLSTSATGFTEGDATLLGAGAAACLGASALMLQAFDRDVRPVSISVWDLYEPTDPNRYTGRTNTGPVDLGHVTVVGAGAVAAALGYWLRPFGTVGRWDVVDRDVWKLHNANRTMGLLPAHAGWPTGLGQPKVEMVAGLLEGRPHQAWYHDWEPDQRPDLVIPLANEYDVRHLIGQRGDPLILHATTGQGWEAQLHRHIAYRDDCIDCRFGHFVQPRFECSTGQLPQADGLSTDDNGDAALPFLSASAGLLLAASLVRLSETGDIGATANWWQWGFLGGRRHLRISRRSCRPGCRTQPPMSVVHRVGSGRFSHLLAR